MIIAFFYSTDLFKSLFVILLVGNSFRYKNGISPARAKVIINPESIYIIIIFDNSLSCIVKFIKRFCLRFCKIYLNRVSKTIVPNFYFGIFIIELVYYIFVDHITISCLKVKSLGIKNF